MALRSLAPSAVMALESIVFERMESGWRFEVNGDPWWLGDPEQRDNAELELLEWDPPAELSRWWRVAGALGVSADGTSALGWERTLLSWNDLVPLTRSVRFGEENLLYDPARMTVLLPDGRRGGWVMMQERPGLLAHWSWQSRELGAPVPLTHVVDRVLCRWLGLPVSPS